MVYFGGFLLLLIIGIFINKNNDLIFLIWSAVLLILIMSLRSSTVGTDSENYAYLYSIIANGGTTILSEKAPLFTFVIKVASVILGDSPQAYFFLTSIMVVVPMWIAISISGVPTRTAVILYYLLFSAELKWDKNICIGIVNCTGFFSSKKEDKGFFNFVFS